MNSKKSFVLYKDLNSVLSDMSDDQIGKLFRAIYKYQVEGLVLDVPPEIKFLLSHLISQFKRDDDKYTKICVSRSEAGKLGAKQKLAKAGKRKHKLASEADNENGNDNESVNDNEKKQPLSAKADVESIVAFYNSNRGIMPEMKTITKSRASKINARIKEYGIDTVKEIILMGCSSPFLSGDNDRGWIADLEWMTKESNFTKISEGKYKSTAVKKKPELDGIALLER